MVFKDEYPYDFMIVNDRTGKVVGTGLTKEDGETIAEKLYGKNWRMTHRVESLSQSREHAKQADENAISLAKQFGLRYKGKQY